ncbi:MAG: hypothetical protein K6T55_12175 [Syntrophobacterales bacterium]|nr:hypothetical protein [Syntrophobacterales bacterium]
MNKAAILLRLALALSLTVPAAAGPPRPPASYAKMEVYAHWQGDEDCFIPLTHGKPPLYIFLDHKGQVHPDTFVGFPSIIPFNLTCGECSGSGEIQVRLTRARLRTEGGRKTLDFAVECDLSRAKLRCPGLIFPLFPSPEGDCPLSLPWEDGAIFSFPAMILHFALRISEK